MSGRLLFQRMPNGSASGRPASMAVCTWDGQGPGVAFGAAGTCGPSRPGTGGRAKPGLILAPVAMGEGLSPATKSGLSTPNQWPHPP
jgi:hypothetical protein